MSFKLSGFGIFILILTQIISILCFVHGIQRGNMSNPINSVSFMSVYSQAELSRYQVKVLKSNQISK